MSLKNLTLGTAIEQRTTYEIIKVNNKSIKIKDAKGNVQNVRARDYHKFSNLSTNTNGDSKASGRFPIWANTETKKSFVKEARRTGTPATKNDYKAYMAFKKSSK